MELVYLWVEDYKNIHKQGFNFSPRFECKFYDKYDENGKLKDNCKLEIIEKKEDEYIKSFFGENINVTAIVGKNGSGKSSILKSLRLWENKNINVFVLFYDIKEKKFIYKSKNINVDLDKEKIIENSEIISLPMFDYSLTYDPLIKGDKWDPYYPDKEENVIS